MLKAEMKCEACGAGGLKRIGNEYVCEFCGSKYHIEGEKAFGAEMVDAKITNLYLKAETYRQKEQYAEELNVLIEALSLDEENLTTLTKIGRCYGVLGFYDKALTICQKAIDISPEYATAYANMGVVYIYREEWSKAIPLYEKALSLQDQSTSDYWTITANYAIAVGKLGNPMRARLLIEEAERHGYQNGQTARKMAGLPTSAQSAQPKPAQQSRGGCYVATCVYHSYDCPEVWTLRRFRDQYLAKRWLGRCFIRFYYAVSPTCVRWFGDRKWFHVLCKGPLDAMVHSLREKGYASTQYYDV